MEKPVNLRAFVLPVLSFAAGAAVLVAWRLAFPGDGSAQGGGALNPANSSASSSSTAAAAPKTGPSSAAPVSQETLAFTGLTAAPTLDDLFNASGIDRPLRVALFLQSASSADIAALLERSKKEEINDTAFTDQIWLRWVEIDRAAAMKADPGGYAVWWAFAKVDPKAALAAALANGKPVALEQVIRSIGQGDHDAAIQLLAEYPAAVSDSVWQGILTGLGKTDRGAAAALALEKNVELEEHVSNWVAREPEAALAWARGLENPSQRRRVMDLAMKERITADPQAALGEIATMDPGLSRTSRTAEAIAALSRTDPAAARKAAEALPNPTDRQRALVDLTETLAERDPAAALDIMQGMSWPEHAMTKVWSYQTTGSYNTNESPAIRPLMKSAPEATLAMLAALPPERAAPVSQAIREWTAYQPEAASRWVAGLATGPVKDTAINGLTQYLTNESPEPDYEAALAWGAAASTPDRQFNHMENTLSTWRNHDWKAARAAVDRLSITPEQRERLLRSFGVTPENP